MEEIEINLEALKNMLLSKDKNDVLFAKQIIANSLGPNELRETLKWYYNYYDNPILFLYWCIREGYIRNNMDFSKELKELK